MQITADLELTTNDAVDTCAAEDIYNADSRLRGSSVLLASPVDNNV